MNTGAYSRLDPVFHAPARLAIVTALYASRNGMSFSELKSACELTDGNLSRHLSRLEDESVLVVRKDFVERRPLTTVTLTGDGRNRFESYLDVLREIVETRPQSIAALPGTLAHE